MFPLDFDYDFQPCYCDYQNLYPCRSWTTHLLTLHISMFDVIWNSPFLVNFDLSMDGSYLPLPLEQDSFPRHYSRIRPRKYVNADDGISLSIVFWNPLSSSGIVEYGSSSRAWKPCEKGKPSNPSVGFWDWTEYWTFVMSETCSRKLLDAREVFEGSNIMLYNDYTRHPESFDWRVEGRG